jgi:hypothetical protein
VQPPRSTEPAPPSPSAPRAQRAGAARGAPGLMTGAAEQDGAQALSAELALLRRVQAALRRQAGAQALAELDAYPRAGGALVAERQAARILALCQLDRSSEAHQLAARFAREHPQSPQQAAIDASCANSKRNGAP